MLLCQVSIYALHVIAMPYMETMQRKIGTLLMLHTPIAIQLLNTNLYVECILLCVVDISNSWQIA